MNAAVASFLKGMGSVLDLSPNKIKKISTVCNNTNSDKSIKKYFNIVEKRMRVIVINEAKNSRKK